MKYYSLLRRFYLVHSNYGFEAQWKTHFHMSSPRIIFINVPLSSNMSLFEILAWEGCAHSPMNPQPSSINVSESSSQPRTDFLQ